MSVTIPTTTVVHAKTFETIGCCLTLSESNLSVLQPVKAA